MAAVVVAVSSAAVAPADAAPVELGGVNVISVSRPTVVNVRVPRAVTVATPFDGGPDIAVSGGAALTAFVLRGTDSRTRSTTLAGGASVVDGRVERFLMPVPQWPEVGGGSYEDFKTFGDKTPIPAGAYRLYVVSSGKATITLSMRGLRGRKVISPTTKASASVGVPDREVTVAGARDNAYAATTTATLKRRGFALQVLQVHMEAEAAWQVVMCHNSPAESAAAQLRDAPGCPAGEKHTLVSHRYPGVTPDTKLLVQAFASLPPGEHGVSTVYTGESYATAMGYGTVWIEY